MTPLHPSRRCPFVTAIARGVGSSFGDNQVAVLCDGLTRDDVGQWTTMREVITSWASRRVRQQGRSRHPDLVGLALRISQR
jgi:hypothetical protein